MPRTAKTLPPVVPAVASDQFDEDVARFDARRDDLAAIDASVGLDVPYECDRIVNETRFFLGEAAHAMLEAGRRLVLLKEHEPHGQFLEILQTRLELSPRTAQVMMKAAIKYGSPALHGKSERIARLGRAKLIELMVEDDEELAALADGGTIAGLTLDEIDRMSVRELRNTLRTERRTQAEEAEAHTRLLAQKDQKINELAGEIDKRSHYHPDQQRAEASQRSLDMLKTLNDCCLNLHAEIARLAQVVTEIYASGDSTAIDGTNETIRWAFQSLADISLQNGIQVDFAETVLPRWLPPALSGAVDDEAGA